MRYQQRALRRNPYRCTKTGCRRKTEYTCRYCGKPYCKHHSGNKDIATKTNSCLKCRLSGKPEYPKKGVPYRRNVTEGFCEFLTQYDKYLSQHKSGTQSQRPQSFQDYYQDKIRELSLADKHFLDKKTQLLAEFTYFKNARPTYKVHLAMANALVDTKIDIPTEELHLPFSSFIINLPDNFDAARMAEDRTDALAQMLGVAPDNRRLCSILVADSGLRGSPEDPNFVIVLNIDYQVMSRRYGRTRHHFLLPLVPGSIEASLNTFTEALTQSFPERKLQEEIATIARLVVGTCFIAISKDRAYVKRERIKIKDNDLCFCGSGVKYKKCCKLKRVNQPIGFAVGQDIVLATQQKPGTDIVVEGRGRALQYGHLRSGFMRWQPKKDRRGNRVRELIFIHPTLVKPNLPMKPKLTERAVRRRKPGASRYRRNGMEISLRPEMRQEYTPPTGGTSLSLLTKSERFLLGSSKAQLALDRLSESDTDNPEDYMSLMDYVVCAVFPEIKPLCFAYYRGEGPQLGKQLSIQQISDLDSMVLVALRVATYLEEHDSPLTWLDVKNQIIQYFASRRISSPTRKDWDEVVAFLKKLILCPDASERRNPGQDSKLRDAERAYAAEPNRENFNALQKQRLRSGLIQFYHDCEQCIPLKSDKDTGIDYYFCPGGRGPSSTGGSILKRYGEEFSEYSSMPMDILQSLMLQSAPGLPLYERWAPALDLIEPRFRTVK